MSEFLEVLMGHTFMQNAMLAGLLASIACGITGSYVVVKRITFVSGGIAHAVFGGLGIAYYLGYNPAYGAIVFAIIAAIITGLISLRFRQHEDLLIGALWSVGMAVGVIFIARTPGYSVNLMSFLFGNILMVSRTDLLVMLALDGVIVLLVVLLYRQFLVVCFDEEYSRLLGIRVDGVYLLLLCLIALTVVVLMHVVGLILVIALLTLPAAVAAFTVRSLGQMMAMAAVLGWLFTVGGLVTSFYTDLPSGAMIIVIAAVTYLVALGWSGTREILRRNQGSGSSS